MTQYPPFSIKIIEPENGDVYDLGDPHLIRIEPSDTTTHINKVEFYIDDERFNASSTSPFIVTQHYPDIYSGEYELKVVAFHSWGESVGDSIEIRYVDYRDEFFGQFEFVVRKRTWSKLNGIENDTFNTTGTVSPFLREDTQDQLYPGNSYPGNIFKSISIDFGIGGRLLTTVLEKTGAFQPWMAGHYYHKGGFFGTDSLNFEITGLGGLSYGIDYYVSGIRN